VSGTQVSARATAPGHGKYVVLKHRDG